MQTEPKGPEPNSPEPKEPGLDNLDDEWVMVDGDTLPDDTPAPTTFVTSLWNKITQVSEVVTQTLNSPTGRYVATTVGIAARRLTLGTLDFSCKVLVLALDGTKKMVNDANDYIQPR